MYPTTRVVQLRNALLARKASARDFDWTPENVPDYFRQETLPAYAAFSEAVEKLNPGACGSDWGVALRIAGHLTSNAKDLGSIQSDLNTTYVRIGMGYGYCADFVKAFLGLSHAAGLFSRQWCFSFDGFGGHGHTAVEVFDRQIGKWCFLDVHNNIHARDLVTNLPLGALEFREALLRQDRTFRIKQNGTGRLGFAIEEKLLAYFNRGLQEWYLVAGNAVFSYDANPAVRWASRLSGSLGQVVAVCLRCHPPIQILVTSENRAQVLALTRLGLRFRLVLVACMALLTFLILQIAALPSSLQMGFR